MSTNGIPQEGVVRAERGESKSKSEKSDRRKKIEQSTAGLRKDSRATLEDIRSSPTRAIVAGAIVIGAGLFLGPAEAALGGAAGLVVYRILRKQRDGAPPVPSTP